VGRVPGVIFGVLGWDKVRAWEVVSGGSGDAAQAVRRNTDNLEIVDEYLLEYPDRVDAVRSGFAGASNHQQYIDDLLGPAPFGSRDVKHRVRGYFQGIDVNDYLESRLADTYGYGITTTVQPEIPGGTAGEFVRYYDPVSKELEMQVAFRNDAPRFLQGEGVPLIQGEGSPTQMYVTLRQIKMMDIPHGEIRTLRLTTIENKETLLWLASTMKQNNYTHFSQVGDLILDTPNNVAGYAVSTIKQAGYRATAGQLVDDAGIAQPITFQELMNMSSYDITPDDLARYNLTPGDETFREFDILINLSPF